MIRSLCCWPLNADPLNGCYRQDVCVRFFSATRVRNGSRVPLHRTSNRSFDAKQLSHIAERPFSKVKRSCSGPAVERPVTATAVVQGVDRE